MTCNRTVLAAAAAIALLAAPAMAADNDATPPQSQAATQDFQHFSRDGFKAMRDVGEARLAIFNGDTNDAKREIMEARKELQSAQNDGTVFMKAESDLKAPKGVTQQAASGSEQIKWLPVDGGLVLDEDYTANAAKKQSVDQANAQMAKGDRAGAAQTLKLADVNMLVDLEVVPLNKAIQGVSQAETLLDSGQFFEANQALRGVQMAARYDEQDFNATPKGRMANNDKTTHG